MKLVWESYARVSWRMGKVQQTVSLISMRAYIPWTLWLLGPTAQATGDFTSSFTLSAAFPICNLRLLSFAFSFFSFLVSWIMIISRICFKLKYLHPLEYKPRLYIAFRKFWFNNKLGQLWLGVLNRSTYDCSYKFCQKCWAQWTGQDYGKCVCQSLLQGQNKVGLALLQSHTP